MLNLRPNLPLNQMSHALNDTIIAKIEAVLIHFIFGIIIYTYLNSFLLFFCNSYFSSINLNITHNMATTFATAHRFYTVSITRNSFVVLPYSKWYYNFIRTFQKCSCFNKEQVCHFTELRAV